jgi:SecD/SecF fusion protein
MDKNAMWKWLVLVVLVCASLWVVLPFGKKIRLGLDLKGGTSFIVKIDEEQLRADIRRQHPEWTPQQVEDKAQSDLRGSQDRALEVIRNRVDKLGISEPVIYPGQDNRIIVQLPGVDEEKRKEAEDSIKSLAFLEFRMVHELNTELAAKLFQDNVSPEGYRQSRIGNENVYITDPAFPEAKRDAAWRERVSRFRAPRAEYEFMLEKIGKQGDEGFRPVFVARKRELTGDRLKDASVDYRGIGQPVVDIVFDSAGAKTFATVTSDYAPGGARNPGTQTHRQLAIVLDGRLYSAPVIREAIYGGKAEISGSFSIQEAKLLENVLRAGSLPAPVKIEETRFVSPTLGKDSIRSGVMATLIGGLAVVIFMAGYYLLNGLIASTALFLNLVLLPLGMIATAGFMSIFVREATGGGPIQLPVLTMPGIAGIVLTFGMAVDANVLVLERMREEMRTGKRFWGVVTAGYDRAFLAIFDSNLTTVLTGVIMFIFGSGPIRGYAVTLCAGIIVSMYTALAVTKMIYARMGENTSTDRLKMFSFIGETNVDFIKWQKVAGAISLAVIVGTWGFMVAKGLKSPQSIFSVDFLGGSSVTMTYAKEEPIESVRAALDKAGVPAAEIQYQDAVESGGNRYLHVKSGLDMPGGVKPVEVIKKTLTENFPGSGFAVAQEDSVGAQVGNELKRKAMWAMIWALVGMIIYLSWRFELSFAVGATVALFHDVLVTAGVFALCGRQFSLPVVAALLTIIGYSVNDTIVIFDRIREDLKLDPSKSFRDICNLSVNQTLSRTLLTSTTALITVVMLLIFGGGSVNDFALTLFIGMLTGVYSTVYIATPVVLWWHKGKRPEMGSKKLA